MSRPIAPVLTRHLMDGGTITPLTGLTEARAELRALLAVARSAKRYIRNHDLASILSMHHALERLEKRGQNGR